MESEKVLLFAGICVLEYMVITRLPIVVRTTTPRFLNFGDACEISVIVQNLTEKPIDVKLAMRSSNARLGSDQQKRFGRIADVPGT